MKAYVIKKGKKYDDGWGLFGPLIEAHFYQTKEQVLLDLNLIKGEKIVKIEVKEIK